MSEPDWFSAAVNTPRVAESVCVAGCEIHYDRWPTTKDDNPGLLFVHGNGAHSHWWDFIAPSFMDSFNVLAMDMSGTGDSGHREEYSALTFANEIVEVCKRGNNQKCYVVGHSFGGSMTRIAGYLNGDELAGVILVDSGIASHRGNREAPRQPRVAVRHYKTLADGMKRFRLRPPQPCANDFILDYIAAHSLRETDEGFVFKLDQALFSKMKMDATIDLPDAVSMIKTITCPVGFIYGDQSRFFPVEAIDVLQRIIDPTLLACVKGAHHHLFLDQPLSFIEALQGILAAMQQQRD